MPSSTISAAEARAIRIDLPWPSRTLHPNARPHWRKKAAATKSARFAAREITKPIGRLDADTINVTCIFSPPPIKRNRDLDGMLSSCKAYFDGIADAIGIDDSKFRHQEPVWGIPCKGGNVTISLLAVDVSGDVIHSSVDPVKTEQNSTNISLKTAEGLESCLSTQDQK